MLERLLFYIGAGRVTPRRVESDGSVINGERQILDRQTVLQIGGWSGPNRITVKESSVFTS